MGGKRFGKAVEGEILGGRSERAVETARRGEGDEGNGGVMPLQNEFPAEKLVPAHVGRADILR